MTLELENVKEDNIGGEGTQQRAVFERLLLSNLSTASRLEASWFQVSSLSVLRCSGDVSSVRAPRVSVFAEIDIVARTQADEYSQLEDETLGRGDSITLRAAAALDLVQVRRHI